MVIVLLEPVLRFTVPNKQGSEVYEFQKQNNCVKAILLPSQSDTMNPNKTIQDIFSLAAVSKLEFKIQS